MTISAGAPSAISVVVPTHRRPESLRRCLEALARQTQRPCEVLVVRRQDDAATGKLVGNMCDGLVTDVEVNEPAQAIAMIAGVRKTRGSIIAFTDDDAVPRPDWLEKMLPHFSQSDVGGVGGRDVVHVPRAIPEPLTPDVGRITRWGKLIGNHHIGMGSARQVAILKGANMAFRREALAIPRDLHGLGAQAHNEIGTSLWAARRGWRLIYDPEILVDHYPAPRFDADRRERPEPSAIRNVAFNYCLALLSFVPELFWRRALFGLLVGDRGTPGVARAALALLRREPDVLSRLVPALVGQTEGLYAIARGRRVSMVSFGGRLDE